MFTVAKVGCRDNGGGGQSGLLKATAMTYSCMNIPLWKRSNSHLPICVSTSPCGFGVHWVFVITDTCGTVYKREHCQFKV